MERVTSRTAAPPATAASDSEPGIQTWQLFALVATASVILAWILNEYVMTREIYYNILGDRLETARIDAYLDLTREYQIWGYLLSPVIIFARIGFVALLLQTVLLLTMVELRFKHLFRTVTWAFLAVLYGQAVRTGWLIFQEPSTVSARILGLTPGAISNLMDPSRYESALYLLMNHCSVFDLLWCGIIYLGINSTGRVTRVHAVATVAGVWLTLTLFTWGITLYATGI